MLEQGTRTSTRDREGVRLAVLFGAFVLATAVLYWVRGPVFGTPGPIPQDPVYHAFADARPLGPIPNAWNVLSNLPFAITGALGLRALFAASGGPPDRPFGARWERTAFAALFGGMSLVSIGSAYYHAWPTNATLLWDRLPLTVAFMGYFALVVADRVSVAGGRALLWPLLLAGPGSVVYWSWTESLGRGDLRPYALVQGFPVLVTPLLLVLFKGRAPGGRLLGLNIAAYVAAKVAETWDPPIHEATGALISGHSLKHLLAGLGCWFIVRWYQEGVAVPRAGATHSAKVTALPGAAT